jgi:hypothetical protein
MEFEGKVFRESTLIFPDAIMLLPEIPAPASVHSPNLPQTSSCIAYK